VSHDRVEANRMRIRRLLALLAVGVGLAAGPAFAAATSTSARSPSLHDGFGLHITSVKHINSRLLALVVTTRALPRPANIYILLPPGYDDSHQRYPVFYLLHGTSGTASDWTLKGDAQKVIGDRPVITVMPDIALDDGGGGWCTDWPDGSQKWETFHIDELIPWVDHNLQTIPTRAERAIAGLSQGGFCSMSYAARHPDLFATALAYSGAPDIYNDLRDRAGAMGVINATEVGLDQEAPDTFFGNPVTDGINWAAHDPATLAENLRWTRMFLYWGNGLPGPYDDTPATYGGVPIELLVGNDNNDFQARLNALHIPAYFDPYGNGTHAWPYWTRDLKQSIDPIMDVFAHPQPTPTQFTYTSADDTYAVYAWQVSMHRDAREFSTLTSDGAGGFSLSGSGTAVVETSPNYQPGHSYDVRMSGDTVATKTISVVAGPDDRLRLTVPLGPSNPYQQETAPAQVAGTAVYTTSVAIR
jgi:S-formylglutathione hydrolase FrmB